MSVLNMPALLLLLVPVVALQPPPVGAQVEAGAGAHARAGPPALQLIHTAPVPMAFPTPGTAFEGGTLLRTSTGLHLFTTDVTRGEVNTSLVYYHAAAAPNSTFTFVREVTARSSGKPGDPKGSLWAPMPSWDAASQRWQLFYVQYRAYGPGHEQDPNWDGSIMHAVSRVPGPGGIGGPYRDVGLVLEPDANRHVCWPVPAACAAGRAPAARRGANVVPTWCRWPCAGDRVLTVC